MSTQLRACRLAILLAMFGSSPLLAASSSATADEHIARFLAHLDANRPVAGTFTLTTEADGSDIEQARQKAEITSRLQPRVEVPPSVERLKYRWFLGDRTEFMMTIPDSGPGKNDFFIDHDVALMRMSSNSFILDKPSHLPIWRPATFYFLHSQLPWRDALSDCAFAMAESAGDEYVTVLARKKAERMVIKLTLDAKQGYLKSASTSYKDKPLFDLVIEDYVTSADQRVFPRKAVFQVFSISSPAKVDRRLTLEAASVSFPTAEAAAREAGSFVVPTGTIIQDKALGRFHQTTRPTTVSDLKRGDVKSVAVSDRGRPREDPIGLPVVRSRTWMAAVAAGICGAALVAIIVSTRVRKGRAEP